ncbi:hypothetical protein [Streptomyces sp. NPDC059788]|uniref:hypothetical protein n=1 Tax=Streptomyces sp. NPDC059788 TaxID=3346948 RepID=UPI003650C061
MRRRYSYTEQIFIEHQAQLTAYITGRMPGLAQFAVDEITQEIWRQALSKTAGPRDGADTEDLPAWIARAADLAIHRRTTPHISPALYADWEALTQLLGHSATWPEHWHRILATQGQQALLRTAAADMAPPDPAPVVPLPSSLGRPVAAAA